MALPKTPLIICSGTMNRSNEQARKQKNECYKLQPLSNEGARQQMRSGIKTPAARNPLLCSCTSILTVDQHFLQAASLSPLYMFISSNCLYSQQSKTTQQFVVMYNIQHWQSASSYTVAASAGRLPTPIDYGQYKIFPMSTSTSQHKHYYQNCQSIQAAQTIWLILKMKIQI